MSLYKELDLDTTNQWHLGVLSCLENNLVKVPKNMSDTIVFPDETFQ
jgi:hypothetical protein